MGACACELQAAAVQYPSVGSVLALAFADAAGTLTQNKLSLNDPILIGDMNAEELVFYAALASKRDGGQDAIDFCICQAAKGAGAE